MARFKEEYNDWKSFWGEVVRMWRAQHGITIGKFLKASFPVAVASFLLLIIGIWVSKSLWQIIISATLLGISGFILIIDLCLVFPYRKWLNDTTALKNRIAELTPLEDYKTKSQEGHEEDWLRLVIDDIDLTKRKGIEDQITVKFHFDSGLVYDFESSYILITPGLGGYSPQEPQLKLEESLVISRGKSSKPVSKIVTVKDGYLLKCIQDDRVNTYENKGVRDLKVEIEFKGRKLRPFTEGVTNIRT